MLSMTKKLPLFIFAAICTLIAWNQSIQAALNEHLNSKSPDNPVVLELFTSQSCSSCPPADRILAEIADKPGVIALGFHVTYWDHLSWKDTLSKKFATERQHAYSEMAGGRRVYTPQMIVNGSTQFVGSKQDELAKALKDSRAITPIKISRDRGVVNIELPDIQNFKGRANIWMFATNNHHTQTIAAGENKGKTVHYANAVQYQEALGAWNGRYKIVSAQIPKIEPIDSIVVLVQYDGYGPIIAAGRLTL